MTKLAGKTPEFLVCDAVQITLQCSWRGHTFSLDCIGIIERVHSLLDEHEDREYSVRVVFPDGTRVLKRFYESDLRKKNRD